MVTTATPIWTDNEMKALVARLAGSRRILLWGEMGVGKSTLAVELLQMFYRLSLISACRLLAFPAQYAGPGGAGKASSAAMSRPCAR